MLVFQTSPLGVELFLMWMLSFVSIYLHRCWPSDWKLSLELLYWCDKISFWTTPPTEICCLHSQIIFRLSKKSFVLLKLWLAAQSSLILCNSWTPRSSIGRHRLLVILSLSRPPGDLQSSICSLYSFSAVKFVSEVNCCKSKSDICSPSGLKDSKRYKPKMMQSQRDEESQMLVKHYIMILLHSESNYYNSFKSVEYLTPNWVTG